MYHPKYVAFSVAHAWGGTLYLVACTIFGPGVVNEFDTLDELREFDPSYFEDTGSDIMRSLAAELGARQRDIVNITPTKTGSTEADGFEFDCRGEHYAYRYGEGLL